MVVSANRLELLQIADAVAREKSIDKSIVIAAMSVSAPIIRWTPQAQVEWTLLVRQGAATLSARMGYLAQPR